VTQFAPASSDAVATRLTASTFRQLIESRDAQFGALAGVPFADQSQGFRVAGSRRGYYRSPTEDALVLRADLPSSG
jgi:hypothetical protein